MKLTGGQVIATALKKYGVKYVAAIPGHGCWAMLDAFLQKGSEIPVIQVMHEQCAVHMADGYWRASGKPMAAMTSIGPGAANTIVGLATAYADSTALPLFTGGPATHMRGHGVMQELDRHRTNFFPQIVSGAVKRSFEAGRVDELPFIMHRAFNAMLSGRPGPVHVEVPMDIQSEAAEVDIHDLDLRMAMGRARPEQRAVEAAAAALLSAERPVIVVGGGAITAEAAPEVRKLAEKTGAVVVTTWNGKSAFPEDHILYAGAVGQTGTSAGNKIAAGADLVVSVGCRFTDWSASSWRKGVSFSFPPAKLVHIDIDHQEIGKNYPTAVGLVADAKMALADIIDAISSEQSKKALARREAFHNAVAREKADWETQLAERRDSNQFPFTTQRPLKELREIMGREDILLVGSGNTQGVVKQTYPVYEPRTHITSGSYSSMGWALPAALGAKLACTDRKVCVILGDGDFMMSMQEMAVAAMHNIPIVIVVQNNSGYMSIRGGQRKILGRHVASEFNMGNGAAYSPQFAEIARSFGIDSWRVECADKLKPALEAAFSCGGPALVEVPTARDAAGAFVPGWWDFPIPAYHDEGQDDYWRERAQEQHL
ncbi:acetolactate synthase [Mesorhizobium sp. LSHC420B00]|nr:acetolactate synthase [Mesorhizobium sp. LSHC420B00]